VRIQRRRRASRHRVVGRRAESVGRAQRAPCVDYQRCVRGELRLKHELPLAAALSHPHAHETHSYSFVDLYIYRALIRTSPRFFSPSTRSALGPHQRRGLSPAVGVCAPLAARVQHCDRGHRQHGAPLVALANTRRLVLFVVVLLLLVRVLLLVVVIGGRGRRRGSHAQWHGHLVRLDRRGPLGAGVHRAVDLDAAAARVAVRPL
jgi:hypothetical protein